MENHSVFLSHWPRHRMTTKQHFWSCYSPMVCPHVACPHQRCPHVAFDASPASIRQFINTHIESAELHPSCSGPESMCIYCDIEFTRDDELIHQLASLFFAAEHEPPLTHHEEEQSPAPSPRERQSPETVEQPVHDPISIDFQAPSYSQNLNSSFPLLERLKDSFSAFAGSQIDELTNAVKQDNNSQMNVDEITLFVASILLDTCASVCDSFIRQWARLAEAVGDSVRACEVDNRRGDDDKEDGNIYEDSIVSAAVESVKDSYRLLYDGDPALWRSDDTTRRTPGANTARTYLKRVQSVSADVLLSPQFFNPYCRYLSLCWCFALSPKPLAMSGLYRLFQHALVRAQAAYQQAYEEQQKANSTEAADEFNDDGDFHADDPFDPDCVTSESPDYFVFLLILSLFYRLPAGYRPHRPRPLLVCVHPLVFQQDSEHIEAQLSTINSQQFHELIMKPVSSCSSVSVPVPVPVSSSSASSSSSVSASSSSSSASSLWSYYESLTALTVVVRGKIVLGKEK